MTFLEECIQHSMPIWEACLETEFLKGIADGSLPEDCFKGYIVDDSLYLREYSKVFAWGMINSHDMEEIRNYYSLRSFVNESEDATRRYYLKRYHITDEEIQPLPLRPENQAYVDTMLTAAREGQGAAECMMACLPCMLSYGWIFGEMIRRAPQVERTPYWPLVSDYAGNRYDADREGRDDDAQDNERDQAILGALHRTPPLPALRGSRLAASTRTAPECLGWPLPPACPTMRRTGFSGASSTRLEAPQ